MNQLEVTLNNLRNTLTDLVYSQDAQSDETKRKIAECRHEIVKTIDKLKGYSGVAAVIKQKSVTDDDEDKAYLTTNPTLCFSYIPSVFESEEEATSYFNRSVLKDNSDYYLIFEKYQY